LFRIGPPLRSSLVALLLAMAMAMVGSLSCSSQSKFCDDAANQVQPSASYPTVVAQVGTAKTVTPLVTQNGPITRASIVSGSLPPGLSLSANGQLVGTPTTAGVYTANLWLANAFGGGSAVTCTVTVVAADALYLAYVTPQTFTVGTATSQTPTLNNRTPGVATSYAVTSGSLPDGLSLAAATGVISGTPTTAGVFSATVTVTNGTLSAQDALVWTVNSASPLTVTYAPAPTGTSGSSVSIPAPTLGNATPGVSTSYSVSAGTLPAGVSLNASTGEVSGTPTTAGVYTFTVTATSGTETASTPMTLVVTPAGNLGLAYSDPTSLPINAAITSQTPTLTNATPGLATTYAVTSGALPTGLSLDSATGAITGTPTVAGSYTCTVTATNGTRSADAALSYSVASSGPGTLNYTTPVTYLTGTAIAGNLPRPTGGLPTSYAVTSGTLPAGLTLDPGTGAISGTPTTAGSYSVTITGTNGTSTSETVAITVNAAPTASLTSNPSVVPVGQASSLTAILTGGTGVITGGDLASPVTVTTGTSLPTGIITTPGTTYTYTLTVTNSALNLTATSQVTVKWVSVAAADSWSQSIPETGGTFTPSGTNLDSKVSVVVPDQGCATCGAVTLTVNTETTLPGAVPSSVQACSTVYNFSTDVGYPFRAPVTVTLAFDPTLTSPNVTSSDLPLPFYWDPTYSEWVAAGLKSVDFTNSKVTFTTLLPGRYVVMAAPGLASALATHSTGFAAGTDDWLQDNLDIYDLPNTASLGMGSFASWYYSSAKASNANTGLYDVFATNSDVNALALISRLANATSTSWSQIWEQSAYGLTDRQTGLALITGLMATGQPQTFLMADARTSNVNNALATEIYSYNTTTGKFAVMDPNYPGNSLTIAWAGGAFSSYDRAMAYSPAFAYYAFEGQTTTHRLSDYQKALAGASAGFPTSSFASIAVTGIDGTSNPDLSASVTVSSNLNVTVSGQVTNGDETATHIFWSQNGESPRTAVALNADNTFSFTIPQLANPYGTKVMLETTSNPCDPTFSHSGFTEFTVVQSGLTAWFPNACFENSTTGFAPWVNQDGSNSGKQYPNPVSYSSNTFTNGVLDSYAIAWTTGDNYSQLVTSPATDPDITSFNEVLSGNESFRVNTPQPNSHISHVYQEITVPTTVTMPKLSFYWSFLAQSAGHAPADEPFMDIVVYDETADAILYYVHHFPPTTSGGTNYTDGYPGWVSGTGSGSSQWFGIDWQKVTLNLGTTRGGHVLKITVTAAGCTQGGHGGYGYLDSVGCS